MQNGIFLVFLVLMIGAMWWMQRSQKKRQQQAQERVNTLEPGTEVITIGGLHGKIDAVHETTIDLDCEGVILTFEKSAVRPPMARPTAAVKAADKPVEKPAEGSVSADKTDDGIEK
ncbi:MAG: preprotein translocase subunit YajC [Streptococcaceae bacterium]|jgi:preprotein translocase subunit YajC|nr:preprotein translocase subunit YajC [Streptococcaceae bacterium]